MSTNNIQPQVMDEAPIFKSESERKIYQQYFRDLPDNYEQFIKNKGEAFNLFSRQKSVLNSGKINSEDSQRFQLAVSSRGTMCLVTIITSSLGIYYLQKGLRFKNIIYGLTYRFTILGFMTKYYLMPQLIARSMDSMFFQRTEKAVQEPILQKYDFNDDFYKELYFKLKSTVGYTNNQQNLSNYQNIAQNLNFQQQQQLQNVQQQNQQQNYGDNQSSFGSYPLNDQQQSQNYQNNSNFIGDGTGASRPQYDIPKQNSDYLKSFRN
ncbi:hypothetical protein PPERSA_12935 [Pseudocohnilembus persalinus]|uniref:Transmembrane protein n=1 Tax=Pseudocohnilembus persalinus TaxID=266149 RepID=A0A0V0R1P1_PSEPJ|nr:hypothetical protein PPERSA_12935 [Pseudocohnilembus persalinus]|eukprot:KRX08454.1 hypothetical protein PPERSA_12935 [Pseudocohnilembus persalinus]